MAGFLLRGGSSANHRSPKLAIRDETAEDERGGSTFLGDARLARMPKAESALMKTPTAAETCAHMHDTRSMGGASGDGTFYGKAGESGVLESRLLQRSTAGLAPGIPRSHMSGYSGHVRGMSEVCGRSYTKCSAIALGKDPKELVLGEVQLCHNAVLHACQHLQPELAAVTQSVTQSPLSRQFAWFCPSIVCR